MIYESSDEFITNRAWLKSAVGDKNMILRCTSALEYLEMFDGYFGENNIDIYSTINYNNENIRCKVVDSYDNINYFKHDNVLCTTFNQTVNDMLDDEFSDESALCEALANYYYSKNESFDGLIIKNENKDKFLCLKEYAVEYYCGG